MRPMLCAPMRKSIAGDTYDMGGGYFLYPDSDSSASSGASTPPYTDYGNHSGDDWTEDEREEKGGS